MQDYLEFTELFQQASMKQFSPTLMMLNTSDMRYATVGCDGGTPLTLNPGSSRVFYQRRFDFAKSPKQSLTDLLAEALNPKPLSGSTCVLVCANVPSEFPEWIQKEMIVLRKLQLWELRI